MSQPREPEFCTLVFGFLRAPSVSAHEALAAVEKCFGPLTALTSWAPFLHSGYYDREMGPGLLRAYGAAEDLRNPEELARWKLAANDLEVRLCEQGRRRLNVDPGWLSLTQVVLATGKAAGHRVLLGAGIYGELEYVFERRTFRPLPWTYPDYREQAAI